MITAAKKVLREKASQTEEDIGIVNPTGSAVLKAYKQTREKLFKMEGIQPQSKIITVQDSVRNIHYLEMGAGQPLILLHGGGSHASEWYNILKPLSEHYHLYVLDRPGCGLSDFMDYRNVNFQRSAKDFIKSFMDAVGMEKAMILGQSLGGCFGINFALEYPQRVDKLVLIGAPAGMNYYIPLILRLMGTKGINKLLGKPSLKNVKDLYKKILVANISNVPDMYLEHTYYGLQLPGTARSFHTLLENVLTLKGWKNKYYLTDQLKQLRVPVRFIWGTKDAFEKPDTGEMKASTIPDNRFTVVENAGHTPWLDWPEKCVSLILSMLKK